MARVVLNLGSVEEFTIPEDMEDENPTVWFLCPMKTRKTIAVRSKMFKFSSDDEAKAAISSEIEPILWECFRYGVQRVKNLLNAKGKEVKIKKAEDGYVDEDWMDYLAPDIIDAVGARVLEISQLQETVKKG